MTVLRRVVFPAAWLLVFLIIAAALVKMAFFSALEPPAGSQFPAAEVVTPTVPVTLGTVANTVELTGTVAADEGVPIRSTAAGEVVFLFAAEGGKVAQGDLLFQVRTPAKDQPAPPPPAEADDSEGGGSDEPGEDAGPRIPAAAPETVYE